MKKKYEQPQMIVAAIELGVFGTYGKWDDPELVPGIGTRESS